MTARQTLAYAMSHILRRRSLSRRAVAFLALACLSLIAVVGWSSYSAYQNDLSEARTSTANMARALADHAEASIGLVDTILSSVVERVENGEVADQSAHAHKFFDDIVRGTPSLQGIFLYDAKGRLMPDERPGRSLGPSVGDREYFIFHRTHPERGARIGNPVLNRSDGMWVIPITRRLNHPDGRFAGVALANIKRDFFRSFYESFAIGQEGAIFLASDQGRFLVRQPDDAKVIGADLRNSPLFRLWQEKGASASGIMVSSIDQIERLYTYRHLRTYPLLISVALSKGELLARWRTSTLIEVVLTLSLLLVLMVLGSRMIRQLIERDRLQKELREAKTALEATNASLKQLALCDGLTGLANRRHFDQRLNAEFKRATRNQTSLALVMIDVDFFKKFNDHHGHVAGDACLQAVAKAVMGGQRREGDIAARFGGEEFVILLPNTTIEGALAVAEGVRATIAGARAEHGASPFRIVTISAGVHACIPARGEAPRLLVEAADRGLYQAKEQGRNRVCAAE
jgi:diguanylate cyclase (GGDEF)-like protein